MKASVRRTIVLLLCLVLTALCVFAGIWIYRLLATTAGDYTIAVLENGSVEIRNYRGSAAALTIPTELKERPVTRIGIRAFDWLFPLTSLTVPEGIEAIDAWAFAGCQGLKEIRLPKSLTEIGENAFSNCRSLSGVILPAGLTALGGEAFGDCPKLTSVSLPDSVREIPANPFTDCRALEEVTISPEHPSLYLAEGVLYDRGEDRLIYCPYRKAEGIFAVAAGTKRIGDSAFLNCDKLTGVELAEGLEAIDDHAFSGCTKLDGVEIPAGVTVLGNAAFSGCRGMTGIVLPEGLREIGYLAFYECRALKEISLPESVTAIGNGAFIGCRNLTITVVPGSYAEEYCKKNGLPYQHAAGREE